MTRLILSYNSGIIFTFTFYIFLIIPKKIFQRCQITESWWPIDITVSIISFPFHRPLIFMKLFSNLNNVFLDLLVLSSKNWRNQFFLFLLDNCKSVWLCWSDLIIWNFVIWWNLSCQKFYVTFGYPCIIWHLPSRYLHTPGGMLVLPSSVDRKRKSLWQDAQ